MSRLKQFWIYIFSAIILLSASCEKIKTYPPEPLISYTAYKVALVPDDLQPEVNNYAVTFKFRLEDGDGNIGLYQHDTTGYFAPGQKYYYNLFVDLYKKIDGKYVINPSQTAWNWRISGDLIRTGQNKTLIADFEKTNKLLISDITDTDTIRFAIYVVDRALNHSNIIYTQDIPFRKPTTDYVLPKLD